MFLFFFFWGSFRFFLLLSLLVHVLESPTPGTFRPPFVFLKKTRLVSSCCILLAFSVFLFAALPSLNRCTTIVYVHVT